MGPPMLPFHSLSWSSCLLNTQEALRKYNLELTDTGINPLDVLTVVLEGNWVLTKRGVLISSDLLRRNEMEWKHHCFAACFCVIHTSQKKLEDSFYLAIGTNPLTELNSKSHYHVPYFIL